jgi:tetratricopeptide (TPR) repeat protein
MHRLAIAILIYLASFMHAFAGEQDSLRLISLFKKASSYIRSNPDSARIVIGASWYDPYLQRSAHFKGVYYRYKGILFRLGNDYPSSLAAFDSALYFFRSINNQEEVAGTENNIANVYIDKGDYVKALESYLRAMKYFEQSGDKDGLARTYNNMGIVYGREKQWDKATIYYKRSAELSAAVGNKSMQGSATNNIGNAYYYQRKYREAEDYYTRAFKLYQAANDQRGISKYYDNMANIFTDLKQYGRAEDFYQKSLDIREKMGDENEYCYTLVNMASFYLETAQYAKAEKALLQGRSIAEKLDSWNLQEEVYGGLFLLYEKTNRPALALEYHKKYIVVRDSLQGLDRAKEFARKEMEYQFDKKQADLKLQQEIQQRAEDEEKQKQAYIRNSFIAGFAIVLIFSVFVYRGYRQKQKANIEISMQKEVIQEKNKEILDSIHYAKRIQQSLMPTDKYIDRNLKRLREP